MSVEYHEDEAKLEENDIYATAKILSRYPRRDLPAIMRIMGSASATVIDNGEISVQVHMKEIADEIKRTRQSAILDAVISCTIISAAAVAACMIICWK